MFVPWPTSLSSYFSAIAESELQVKALAYVGISARKGFIVAPHTTLLYNAFPMRRRWEGASGCWTEGGFWTKIQREWRGQLHGVSMNGERMFGGGKRRTEGIEVAGKAFEGSLKEIL